LENTSIKAKNINSNNSITETNRNIEERNKNEIYIENPVSANKIMDNLFSEKNIFIENQIDNRVKNFYGEENLKEEKNSFTRRRENDLSNNSCSNNVITINNNNIVVNNHKSNSYFVNSNSQSYKSHNVSFKNNFFLDREYISKTFDVTFFIES